MQRSAIKSLMAISDQTSYLQNWQTPIPRLDTINTTSKTNRKIKFLVHSQKSYQHARDRIPTHSQQAQHRRTIIFSIPPPKQKIKIKNSISYDKLCPQIPKKTINQGLLGPLVGGLQNQKHFKIFQTLDSYQQCQVCKSSELLDEEPLSVAKINLVIPQNKNTSSFDDKKFFQNESGNLCHSNSKLFKHKSRDRKLNNVILRKKRANSFHNISELGNGIFPTLQFLNEQVKQPQKHNVKSVQPNRTLFAKNFLVRHRRKDLFKVRSVSQI